MAGWGDFGKLISGAKSMTDSFAKAGAAAEGKLGAPLRGLAKLAESASEQLGGTANSLADFAGKADEAGGILPMVTDGLRSLGPEGEAVAVILQVLVTVLTAVVNTLWEFATAAVAISQEKDALALTFAALTDGATQSVEAGRALVDEVSELAASLPQAEGAVLAWAKAMMAAGIQGEALKRAVTSVASAEALMGKAGASAAEALIKRFAMTAEIGGKLKLDRRLLTQMAAAGVSASALAKALGVPAEKLSTMAVDATKLGNAFQTALTEKGAAALENMSLTWASISAKLSDGWEDLFEDMGDAVRPLMIEIRSLFSEFFAGSSAMTATKGVLTSVLTSLLSVATKVVHAVHTGFLHIQIAALQVAIFVAPLVNLFRRIYSNAIVLQGLKYTMITLALPFIAIAAAIFGVIIAIGGIITAIGAFVALVVAGVSYVHGMFVEGFQMMSKAMTGWSDSAKTAATNFINGLVGGIANGVSSVVSAVKGLANSAVSAFSSTLGIKSPSRVMMRLGGFVAEGAAMGVQAGQGRVAAASTGIGAAAATGAASGAQGGGAGRSLTLNVEPGAIVIQGGGKSAVEIGEEVLAVLLEKLAMSQGLGVT